MIRRFRKRMTLASLKRHIDRRFATKADLHRFATKNDLRRFATKEDMTQLEVRTLARFAELMRRIESLDGKKSYREWCRDRKNRTRAARDAAAIRT